MIIILDWFQFESNDKPLFLKSDLEEDEFTQNNHFLADVGSTIDYSPLFTKLIMPLIVFIHNLSYYVFNGYSSCKNN